MENDAGYFNQTGGSVNDRAALVVCGLAGCLSGFTVPIVGLMPAGELILVVVAPWVLLKTYFRRGWCVRMQQLNWFKLMLVLIGVMAFGYVASDLYRGTATNNLLRGWARVGFFAVDLVTITYLIGSSWRRFFVFVLALYLGGTANAVINGPLNGEWWKFGVGYTITVVGLFAVAGRSSFLQVVVALLLGVLSLVLGARSLGSVCFLTGGLLGLRHARGVLKALVVLISIVAIGITFFSVKSVVDENQDHSGSNIERRSMIETAAEAFIGSPLIGQGSWFTATKIHVLEERMAKNDPNFRGYSEDEVKRIAIHSQLLVSLAEGGILGGLFFLGLAVLLFKTLRTLVRQPMPHRALLFYMVLSALWNLCMSPFSGVARIEIILGLSVCLLVILQQQGELSEDFRE